MKRIILTLGLALAATAARSQTVTSQYTSVLSDSPGSDTPLAVVADAQPSPDSLTPAFSVAVPNAQTPRLLNLVNPAIAIPFGSGIREIEANWNGTPLPLIDPSGTELVDEAHSYGSMIPFFKPLFSLVAVPAGPGTLEIRAFDSNHVQLTSVAITNLTVVRPPLPIAASMVAALPHPRIYLTAARLATIEARPPADIARQRYERALNLFTNALAEFPDVLSTAFGDAIYDPESYIPHLALTYHLRKSTDPATAALVAGAAHTLVTNLALAYDTGRRDFGRDTGYDIRFGLRNLMLAYDWMYEQFSAPERVLIVRVATNWVNWYHTNSGYAESRPVENYYAGYLQGIALTTFATAGDTPNTDNLFTLLRTKLGREVPIMNQKLAGGDWAEGWNYGPYSVAEFSLVNTLLRDAGEDWSPDFDWLQSLPRSLLYMTAPDFSQTRSYGGYSGNYPNRTSPAMLAVLSTTTVDGVYAAYLYAAMNANSDNDFSDVSGDTFYEMIFATNAPSPNLAALPLSYFNSGTGRFFSRSSLTNPEAYFVSAENTSYSYDHYGYANGDVRLYHGTNCLVCPSAYRGPAFDGEAETPAFSTYRVNNRDQNIDLSRNNQNMFVMDRGAYSAIAMRFESSWASSRFDENIVDPANPLDYIIREIVHLRPGTLIIRDLHRRRHASDTLDGQFHLGLTNTPQTVSGGYQVGPLEVSTFYPQNVTVSFGDDTDGGGNLIGTLMQLGFASSTAPMELVTVFSEALRATNYANRVLSLNDGTHIVFSSDGTFLVLAPPVSLNIQRIGNAVTLRWTNPAYALQEAPAASGTFTNVPGATSPYTSSITTSRQFFRLKAN